MGRKINAGGRSACRLDNFNCGVDFKRVGSYTGTSCCPRPSSVKLEELQREPQGVEDATLWGEKEFDFFFYVTA